MDLQEIVGKFFQQVASDPSHLEAFGLNPAEALKNATGLDLNTDQLSGAIESISSMITGGGEESGKGAGLDLGAISDMAGSFFKESGEDVLGALSGLFAGKK